jgi:hypothetical protein
MPKLGDFIARATSPRYRYRLRSTPGVAGPRGKVNIPYLIREEDGRIVDLTGINPHERLTRIVLESLCERAGIPLEDFGITP